MGRSKKTNPVEARSSLLLAAEAAADAAAEAERKHQHVTERAGYARSLAALRRSVDAAVLALDGQSVRRGVFKVEKRHDAWLVTNRRHDSLPEYKHGDVVFWYSAEIYSGTYDGSDDCRDIPYTTPMLSIRIYSPDSRCDRCVNGTGGEVLSASSSERVEKLLHKLAVQHLAQWVK